MLAHPNIGPALAAAGFVDAAFERVPGAFGIGGGGLGLAKQLAQIEKVLLGGAALRQGRALPFRDELLRSHPGIRGPRVEVGSNGWILA
jgi:hypothetical protein